MKLTSVLLACACILLYSIALPAQSATGQISGTVFDPSGALIPGASIKVTSVGTGVTREAAAGVNGTFVVPSLPAGMYIVQVEMPGFRTYVVQNVEVTVGADYSLRVVMETGSVDSTITVTASAVQVQTSEASVSNLVDEKTLVTLPLNRRNPLHLLSLIPGVVGHSAEATTATGTVTHYVNGDRGRGVLTTLDGIDISDPIIPRGELTNAPVNPDMVQEFRVTTALARAEYGRNSGAQIEMITKSGTNELHGNAYEFLRNTALDANSFFNNHLPDPITRSAPIPRELLQQNQFGAAVGGPIIKNKMFYFFNYEGIRRKQAFLTSSTVFTPAARQGIFRFVRGNITLSDGRVFNRLNPALVDPGSGSVRGDVPLCGGSVATDCLDTYNIVASDPRRLGLDPVMQQLINLYPAPNDYTTGDGLNTAFFRWNSPSEAPADVYAGKVDYIFNSRYEMFARYNLAWRNDLIGDFINDALGRTPRTVPARSRLSRNQGAAAGFKMIWSPSLLNDLRFGFTRTSLQFVDTTHPIRSGADDFGKVPELRTTAMNTPFVYWGGTFRYPEHFQLRDGISWQRGPHALRFGGDLRFYRFNNRRDVGSNPQGSGISVFPSVRFTEGVVPFTGTTPLNVVPNATDRTTLERMYNELLGIAAQVDQIMYSDGSQYAPGNGLIMYQRQREYSLYFQDDWRLHRRFTLNLGLRYELFGVPYDDGGLQVVPDKPLQQGPVTFLKAGPGTGRQWYGSDTNDLAPALGFAWDFMGDGRTALRGGYRINYNRLVAWALNVVEQRQPAIGLDPQIRGECRDPNTGAFGACGGAFSDPLRLPEIAQHPRVVVNDGLPSLRSPVPNQINATPPDTRRESPFFFADDFRSAKVHQFSLSLQRELAANTVLEVGYIGSRGLGLFRFLNVDDIEIRSNGFLQEFVNARKNLEVCRANPAACRTAAGSTSATFASFADLGLPGQVPVPIFTSLFSATGSRTAAGFTDATSLTNLDQNNIGTLADRMDKSQGGSRGPLAAFARDNFFRPNPQFDVAGLGASVSRSWYNSLQLQIRSNYRNLLQYAFNYTFQKSIDDTSNETVAAGTAFDFPYDSKNLRLNRARSDFDVSQVFRGYAIYDLPVGRGRRFGSSLHPVFDQIVGGWQVNTIIDISTGFPFTVSSGSQTNGYFTASPADCGAGGRGTANVDKNDARGGVWLLGADDSSNLSIPAAGMLGSCGRNTFTGAGYTQFDFGIFKSFRMSERSRLDFRAEMFNAFNQANFNNPTEANRSIQSATFGKVTSLRAPNRVMQFALKLIF